MHSLVVDIWMGYYAHHRHVESNGLLFRETIEIYL